MPSIPRSLLLINILGFLYLLSHGQPTDSPPVWVDEVSIVGNEKTRDYIILREIPFSFPDTLHANDFLLIQNRLQNLYLFNRVELHLIPVEDKTVLYIIVTESWYLFPVPLLFINEHDWSKISYGLQFTHYNFRGKNEKLRVGGWLGYNPSFFFSYHNPWIGKKLRMILGLGAAQRRVQNKIFDFEEDRLGFSVNVGRKLSLNIASEILFSLDRIRLPEAYRAYSVSGDGEDFLPSLAWQVSWDRRDLFEYPKKGFYLFYKIQKIGFTEKQPDLWRFYIDNRYYQPIYRSISLGARQLLELNHGEMPVYDRLFLGFEERIRGYFSRVLPDPSSYASYPSNQISLTSFELRFPILPIRYISLDDGPLIPSLYQNLKFGISGGIFMDSGIAWKDRQDFGLNNFFTGYGAGIHIHLPYVQLLRLDFAWNDQGKSEVIIDVQVSF